VTGVHVISPYFPKFPGLVGMLPVLQRLGDADWFLFSLEDNIYSSRVW